MRIVVSSCVSPSRQLYLSNNNMYGLQIFPLDLSACYYDSTTVVYWFDVAFATSLSPSELDLSDWVSWVYISQRERERERQKEKVHNGIWKKKTKTKTKRSAWLSPGFFFLMFQRENVLFFWRLSTSDLDEFHPFRAVAFILPVMLL